MLYRGNRAIILAQDLTRNVPVLYCMTAKATI